MSIYDTTTTAAAIQAKTPLFFSWELATRINPRQPDVIASTVLYGLYTWQVSGNNNHFGYHPTINGMSCCYRSVRELEKDYTTANGKQLCNETVLWKALRRAEKALGDDFVVKQPSKAKRGKLHYLLSAKLISNYRFYKRKNTGLTKYLLEDAVEYGVVGAILLSNLDFQIETFPHPVTDGEGNKYGELNISKLTQLRKNAKGELTRIIPKNRDTVSDAIKYLIECGAIIAHPTEKSFFKRLTNAEERNTYAEERNRRFCQNAFKPCNEADCEPIAKTPDSNTDRKCYYPETFPLRFNVSGEENTLSINAKKLMRLIAQDIKADTKAQPSVCSLDEYAVYNVIDCDKAELIGWELPYDFFPIDVNTGKMFSRSAEIAYVVKRIIDELPADFSCTAKDAEQLRELFSHHSLLTYDHISSALQWCLPRQEPLYIGNWESPSTGWDEMYFSRRAKSLKQFLRYLPQVLCEQYNDETNGEFVTVEPDGTRRCDYSRMMEPLLTIAFSNGKQPITYEEVQVGHVKIDESNDKWRFGVKNPKFAQAHPEMCAPTYVTEYTQVFRPIYFHEWENRQWVGEPQAKALSEAEYQEYVGAASNGQQVEYVEHAYNPILCA